MSRGPEFIMTAGPVQLSDRVRGALGAQIVPFLSVSFFEMFRDTEAKLKEVFKTTQDIVFMQGEALLALEAVSVCGLDPGEAVVNCENGYYGEGNRFFIEKYGGVAVSVRTPWHSVVGPEQLEAALQAHPEARIVWIVHCETPSGTICDLEALTRVAKAHGCLVFVDAASSLGSRDIRVDEWGIDVLVAGSQKVLGAPPGLSAMSVSPAAWQRFRDVRTPNRHSYMSILDWKEKWLDRGAWPYTPSVSEMSALHAAVDEYLEVGVDEWYRRYAEVARMTRAGVRGMGLEIWPEKDEYACEVTTAVKVPEGIDAKDLLRRMEERFGVVISGSITGSVLDGRLVRVGHMGVCCSPTYALAALAAMEQSLRAMGLRIASGSGVGAALEAMD
ncbi:MAG: pyridoxal-phosphate-dependent aminotransferase family protein [Thermoleophilia bacterium]